MPTFPTVWKPGMALTADRLNARNVHTVQQVTTVELGEDSWNSQLGLPTEIRYEVEPNAMYRWWCGISYSAVALSSGPNQGVAIGWRWTSPTGASMGRFSMSYVQDPTTGINSGSPIIMRRPADNTYIQAGGTNTAANWTTSYNFMTAQDRGLLMTGDERGEIVLHVGRFSNEGGRISPILHGGNQTRLLIERIG